MDKALKVEQNGGCGEDKKEKIVSHQLGISTGYGDVEHDGWTMEEEEDYEPNGKGETSSDEDEAPLPQPGDMQTYL